MWSRFFRSEPTNVSVKQALKRLLKHKYASLEEYDRYVKLLEDSTGHPDVDGYLKSSQIAGKKPKTILSDLNYEADLYQALIH